MVLDYAAATCQIRDFQRSHQLYHVQQPELRLAGTKRETSPIAKQHPPVRLQLRIACFILPLPTQFLLVHDKEKKMVQSGRFFGARGIMSVVWLWELMLPK